jgi:hypothetical protein
MNKFTATFADGTTITRKTGRDYAVAWRATWTDESGRPRAETGFSVSREKAIPYRPEKVWAHRDLSSNERARAVKENADFLARSGYQVEFAQAVRA